MDNETKSSRGRRLRAGRMASGISRLVDALSEAVVVVDTGGTIVRANGEAAALFGYAPGELEGRSVELLVPEAMRDAHRERRQRFDGRRTVLMSEGVDLAAQRKDGSSFPVEISLSPIASPQGPLVAALVRDRSQAATAQRLLETVIRNIPVALFATDRKGRIAYCDGSVLDTLDFDRAQVVGRDVSDVLVELPDTVEILREAVVSGGTRATITVRDRILEVYFVPPRAGRGTLGMAVDVTDRANAERLLAERERQLSERSNELQALNDELEATLNELSQSRAELEQKSLLLAHALDTERERARTDPLTRALNHGAITTLVQELVAHGSAIFSVVMVDVDGMKLVNDTYGHQMGDRVLIAVADTLRRDNAIVGRYGGDEFVVVLPGAASAQAQQYAGSIMRELNAARIPTPDYGAEISIAASTGIAVCPEDGRSVDELIKLSDAAMYAAKRRRYPSRRERQSDEAA